MIRAFSAFFCMLVLTCTGQAADYTSPVPTEFQTSVLRGSIGLRYWYSQNNSEIDTGDLNWNTVDDVTSHTAEIFGEIEDTTTNMFARAYLGLGRNFGGEGDFYIFPSGQS